MEYKRECDRCRVEIRECMGFVNAGDFLKRMQTGLEKVRELCGLCVFKDDLEKGLLDDLR